MADSFIRNTKHPYDGVCVVLEVRDDRLKVFTERGEYVEIERRYAAAASIDDCITPTGSAKLNRALVDYRRRQRMKEYSSAVERADSAERSGSWSEAAAWYAKALSVDAGSDEALAKRATCLRRSGCHAEALSEYGRLIEGGRTTASLYLEQAMSLDALGHLHEAIEGARHAFEMNGNLAEACRLISELHRKLSDQHQQQAETYEQKRRAIVNPDGRFSAESERGQISLFE